MTPASQLALAEFALSGINLLVLDDLWSWAVRVGDTSARQLGLRMGQQLHSIRADLPLVAGELERLAPEVNAAWDTFLWRQLSSDDEDLVRQLFEGTNPGAATAVIARNLDSVLEGEAQVLQRKLHELELEGPGPVLGDLLQRTKLRLCLVIIGAVLLGADMATSGVEHGTLVAVQQLAPYALYVTVDSLRHPDLPPPRTPTPA